jgi:hypothetical protein
MLFINEAISQNIIVSWTCNNYKDKCEIAIKLLKNLGLFKLIPNEDELIFLNESFKNNLCVGIFGGTLNDYSINNHQKDEIVNNNNNNNSLAPTELEQQGGQSNSADIEFIDKLDNYATERWESVLKYIVNPKDVKNQISISTKNILKFSGLMRDSSSTNDDLNSMITDTNNENADSVVLSASAFQFLLWNTRVQVWYFIIQLLDYCHKENGQDISECLTLLFELSFSTFGKDYSCDNFSKSKEYFLQELRKLGLVFMKTVRDTHKLFF